MNNITNLRVKLIKIWRNNKRRLLIFLIILLIVIIINNIVKNMPQKIEPPSISYNPNVIVMSPNNEKIPEKKHEEIVDIVDVYFNYCNNGEYKNAYNCISDECKKTYYPTLESFTSYINNIFEGKKKIYNIQAYSVIDNIYVYNIKILDDILANGTTDGYYYYEEKLILKEENGSIKLSIGELINSSNPEILVEDDYMVVQILEKITDYKTETYKINIKNKSDDKYIVIADGKQNNEVLLIAGNRQKSPNNNVNQFIIKPGATYVQEIKFDKYYDDGKISNGIKFGAVRILEQYDFNVGTTQEILNNAIKLYSIEIPF